MMRSGLLLIAAAAFLSAYNVWSAWQADETAKRVVKQVAEQMETPSVHEKTDSIPGEQEIPDYLLDPGRDMPEVTVDGNTYIGTLEIPDLELFLPVMSDWSYPKLRISPCRYAGSAYQGNLILAAHNYDAHFGRIGSLSAGSPITFTDVDGNRFEYIAEEIQILNPADIEEMTSEEWRLTLFTCTPGGTARLAVRCSAAQESFAWAE